MRAGGKWNVFDRFWRHNGDLGCVKSLWFYLPAITCTRLDKQNMYRWLVYRETRRYRVGVRAFLKRESLEKGGPSRSKERSCQSTDKYPLILFPMALIFVIVSMFA